MSIIGRGHGRGPVTKHAHTSKNADVARATRGLGITALLGLAALLLPLQVAHAATVTPGTATLISENGELSSSTRFSLQADFDQEISTIQFCDRFCGEDADSAFFISTPSFETAIVDARDGSGEWQVELTCSSNQGCFLDVEFQSELPGNYPAEIILDTLSTDVSSSEPGRTGSANVTGVAQQASPGSIRFSQQAYTVDEDAGSLTVVLERINGSSGPLSVSVQTSNGSAIANLDYGTVSTTVSWADNDIMDRTVSIPILSDSVAEDVENFFVLLDEGDLASAPVTIQDVPPAPIGLVQFDPTSYSVNEDGGSVTVTAVREGGTNGELIIGYSTEGGSADNGSDYTEMSGTFTWGAGQGGSRSATIPILADDDIEGDEFFSVFLSDGGSDVPLLGPNSEATVTIMDVLPAPRGLVQFVPNSYSVSEDGGSITVTAVREGGTNGEIIVGYGTEPGSANGDIDYEEMSGTLTWPNGQGGSMDITIPILSDLEIEDDEQFSVFLTAPSSSDPVLGDNTSAIVTIENVDPAPTGRIVFTADAYSAGETDGSVLITLMRVDGERGEINVDYFTTDDTAFAGEDYVENSGGFDWADGDMSPRTIEISLLTDDNVEPTENFFVVLSNELDARVDITDVPPFNPGTAALTQAAYSVSETEQMITITAERTVGSDGDLIAVIRTADGSAEAGSDYTATTQRIEWLDGQTGERSVDIPILTDELLEEDETFLVSLSILAFIDDNGVEQVVDEALVTIADVQPDMPGSIQFSLDTYTVGETAGMVSVIAQRVGGNDGELTMGYFTRDGSAVAGPDYVGQEGTLIWEDNDDAPQTIEISILTDEDGEEGNETFFVDLSNEQTTQVTIIDVPPFSPGSVALTATAYTVSETGQTVTITAERTGGSDGMITAVISSADGTALAGDDYTATTQNIVWLGGQTGERSVDIPILTDELVEQDETFGVSLTVLDFDEENPIDQVVDEAVVTIIDVPPFSPGSVALTATTYTVSETAQTVTITAERTGGSDGMITTVISTADGTALAGDDYTATTQNIVWLNGQTGERSVDIPILTDELVEPSETFLARLSAVGSEVSEESDGSEGVNPIGEANEAVITITDVPPDMPGTIQFSLSTYTVAETDGMVNVIAQRVGGNDGELTMGYSTRNGTADSGPDYVGQEGTLTWADDDDAPQTIEIAILTDEDGEEGNETFFVDLNNEQFTQVTIIDVPPFNPGSVAFTATTYTVSEIDQTVTLTAERTGGTDGVVTTIVTTADGTAEAGDDYTAVEQRIIWMDGQSGERTVTVPILTDEIEEQDESFFARLSAVGSGESEGESSADAASLIGDANEAEITITDVTEVVPGSIEFSLETYTVDETDETVQLVAERIGGSDGELMLSYATRNGTAEGGEDYAPTQGTLVWNDGDDAPQTIDIGILSDDDGEEGDENFFVDVGTEDSVEVVITDVPPLSPGFVEFAPVSYSALESDGEVTISATRQQGSDGEITVIVSTVDGTATAGSDFTATTEELTWTDNDTSPKSFTIALIEDDTAEDTERLTVSMTLAEEGEVTNGSLGSATTATIDIEELPVVEPGTLQFSTNAYSASETDGTVELTVTRTGGSDGAISVLVSTSDGTAEAGEDYEATQDQLSWADGELGSRTLSVTLNEDVLEEDAETFTATLSLPAGQDMATLGAPSIATVTIADVAPPPELGTVQFTAATVSVDEDEESVELQISRTGGQDGAITMSVRTRIRSATLGEDYQFEPVTVSWADQDNGQRSLTIPIELDNLDEPNETFGISLVATPANEQALGTPDTVIVTIRDVSNPFESGTLALARSGYTVSEAQGTVTVAVNRTGGSEGAVSVQYDTVAGSAESPEDFTASTGRLSWEDGDTSPKQVTLTIAADVLVEDDEQFEVAISDPQGPDNANLDLGRTSASVTIQDSTTIGRLQFTSENFSGAESDELVRFSVERVDGSDGPVSVDYQLRALTATAGEDYIAVSGTLNWADGDDNQKTGAIQLLTDAVLEGPETFEVILMNAQPVGDEQIAQGLAVIVIRDSTTIIDPGPLNPYVLTIISGDNQSLIPGDILDPLVLQASVEPPSTAEIANVAITWRVEPEGSAELLNTDQTVTDANGMASNQVRVLDRGFVRVLARVGQAVQPEPFTPGGLLTGRIAPPSIDLNDGEIAFTLRSGLFAAEGLNNNQAQTGGALDAACVALDFQVDPENNDPMPLTAAQLDLQATCRALELRLADGTLAPALDRLAPEELFTLGDSVIDTTDLHITNVYSRINAIRGGRTDSLDVSGLNLDVRGELIPGSVIEAAQNTLPSGGAASADGADGFGPRLGVFANGALSIGEVDGDDNQRDADVSTTGLTVGMDYRISANSVVGVGLGIANNETEFTRDEGRVDVSAVNLSLFATYYEEDLGYVDVVLDAGQNQFDVERRIDLPGTERRIARGSTDANVLALTLGVGFDKNFGSVDFGPYGRVSFVDADVDAYQETADSDGVGSGSVLAIESHSVRSTTLSVGAQASRSISTRSGVFVPQINIEGEFELVDRKGGITASFQHDPSQTAFEVNGNERDSSYLNIGLGSSFLLANGRSGYVFYETRAQHDFVTQHWLKLGLRLEFR